MAIKKASKTTVTLEDGSKITLPHAHNTYCRLYLTEKSGAEAYRKSVSAGASPVAAAQGSYKLLQKDDIQRVIEHYKSLAAQKISITEDAILDELSAIASHNIADCYDENKLPKHIKDLPLALQRAIKSFKLEGEDSQGNPLYSYVMYDKLKAIETISKIRDFGSVNDKPTKVVVNNGIKKPDEEDKQPTKD